MRTIAKLFGKSPFAPLQQHMNKVAACISELEQAFTAFQNSEYKKMEIIAKKLSKLEHEADLAKNDIRNNLPKSVFLPIDRSQILEMLAIQDSLADTAENIGLSLILYPLPVFEDLKEDLQDLLHTNINTFSNVQMIINEMDILLESSFGGIEAERVKAKIEEISSQEHESGLIKYAILKKFFSKGKNLEAPAFFLWLRIIEEISSLAHISERLANRIRMVLALK
ncbi:MAG: TIGR00153 family protein [Chlamydiales bacterium]